MYVVYVYYHHFECPRATLATLQRALRSTGGLVLVDFMRTPGQSSDWVLNHVRAGQEIFEQEITAAGFLKTGEEGFLKENYFLRFRRADRGKSAADGPSRAETPGLPSYDAAAAIARVESIPMLPVPPDENGGFP